VPKFNRGRSEQEEEKHMLNGNKGMRGGCKSFEEATESTMGAYVADAAVELQ